MALGVLENMPLRDEVIQIQPGNALVLYTDGVTETFSPSGEPFGEARLQEALGCAASCRPNLLLSSLDAALNTFRATQPLSDDITLIALYRKP